MDLPQFISKWSASGAAERANKDSFLLDLCDFLDVPRPDPSTGIPERDLYVFERDALLIHEGGRINIGKIDLYKHGCFLLEAKQGSSAGSPKIGSARRGTPAWNISMRDAYGQALGYARTLPTPPPFLITCDIGYCFDLYASFDGSWNYRPFPDGQSSRIFFQDIGRFADRLRRIFIAPSSLDPSRNAALVTREIAGHIAELAHELEQAGHDPERVATFLMRCLFTLFAEDVGLLPGHLFTETLEKYWLDNPASFPDGVRSLWQAMNEGASFLIGKLKRFNGGLFAEQAALPLSRRQLERILDAARCNWAEVEPAIFGTLLERALDPRERQRLGAHYTPRAYVERLVRLTVEEPLRHDWDLVRAEVRSLVETGRIEEAKESVRSFHGRLTKIRILDPACGSGNFLYVSLDLFKRLESEVLGLLSDLGEKQILLEMERVTVTPEQFRGIEVKRWAKEIAELVLWIGYLQWQVRTKGSAMAIPEPVLRDYGNIEHRDALLAWDRSEQVRREHGKMDETSTQPVDKYTNPKKAEWPPADFIVGNPPFLGKLHIGTVLGQDYAEALRSTYREDVPDSADLVMYWWRRAANLAAEGRIIRFGFVTTNSIKQTFNSRVVKAAFEASNPIHLVYAIPDHPWSMDADSAGVRIAMTVGEMGLGEGRLLTVLKETVDKSDEAARILLSDKEGAISPDLKVGINLSSVPGLRANSSLASMGPAPGSRGFLVTEEQYNYLLSKDGAEAKRFFRPLVNGRDILYSNRNLLVIDLSGEPIDRVRKSCPATHQYLYSRVYSERAQNNDPKLRALWWLFRRSNELHRNMLRGLPRFIATVETAKHRVFVFLDGRVIAEHGVISFGLSDAYFLGVLSSRVHVLWTLATGGTLEDRPRYNKTRCFDPFPFPACADEQKARIRELGEALDVHRKCQKGLYPDLTITGMYNVLEKLRAGALLNNKEKLIHEQGLVSILKKIHDELDAAVFDAYEWPYDLADEEILERLVTLNAERVEQESKSLVQWLRPDFQRPAEVRQEMQAGLPRAEAPEEERVSESPAVLTPWPKSLPDRVSAIRSLLGGQTWDIERLARKFKGAKRKDVESVLDSLAALGLAVAFTTPEGRRWRGVERSTAI